MPTDVRIVHLPHSPEWCNGSTPGFGPGGRGSNPCLGTIDVRSTWSWCKCAAGQPAKLETGVRFSRPHEYSPMRASRLTSTADDASSSLVMSREGHVAQLVEHWCLVHGCGHWFSVNAHYACDATDASDRRRHAPVAKLWYTHWFQKPASQDMRVRLPPGVLRRRCDESGSICGGPTGAMGFESSHESPIQSVPGDAPSCCRCAGEGYFHLLSDKRSWKIAPGQMTG